MNRQDGKEAKNLVEPDIRLDALARRVGYSALEVHRTLGPGFLESVYEEALAVELRLQGIAHDRQVPIRVLYKGYDVGIGKLDILVENQLVVELKAVQTLTELHIAQVLSYLKAGRLHLGLLINFNVALLRHGMRRVVCTP